MDNIIAGAVMRAPHADAVASHRFAAGHMVRLSRAIPLRNAAAGNYEVLAQLPRTRSGQAGYRRSFAARNWSCPSLRFACRTNPALAASSVPPTNPPEE